MLARLERAVQVDRNRSVFGKLFKGRKDLLSLEALSKQAEIIVSSTIQKKDLFFNEANMEDIDRLYLLMNPERFSTVMERLRSRGRKASAACLLYGAPGTGKTELAKQLALTTGRDLVIADAAKLYASWHGDTEKNVKELFETYQYVQSISNNAPILLFNEADGLLSKRTDVMRQAVDKIENRIQNLFCRPWRNMKASLSQLPTYPTTWTPHLSAASYTKSISRFQTRTPVRRSGRP